MSLERYCQPQNIPVARFASELVHIITVGYIVCLYAVKEKI
jgi:hypothetical protein